MSLGTFASRPFFPALVAGLLACGGDDLVIPPETTQVQMVRGDDQVGPAGAALPDPLIVRLVDAGGNGIPNRAVLWVLRSGGGGVTPTTGTTDAEGYASAEWTLGSEPGLNSVEAQVPDVGSVIFTATVTGTPGTGSIELVAGDNQQVTAGTQVPTAPAVRVRDANGDPVEGVAVTFQVTGGGGEVSPGQQTTDENGIARVEWTLGDSPGTNTLEARADELTGSPVVFTAEGISPESEVDRLVFLSQPSEAKKGQTFSVTVALVDNVGNVVPLSGIFIYLDLFPDGSEVPDNQLLRGEHFENTENGVAVFDIRIERKGTYRIRALTDDLPELGVHGPEPYLFSSEIKVK